jgi:hypothetical protein
VSGWREGDIVDVRPREGREFGFGPLVYVRPGLPKHHVLREAGGRTWQAHRDDMRRHHPVLPGGSVDGRLVCPNCGLPEGHPNVPDPTTPEEGS